jgi:hypothetical protein
MYQRSVRLPRLRPAIPCLFLSVLGSLGAADTLSAQAGAPAEATVFVRASSMLGAGTTTSDHHDAELMFDGNPLTAWVEGSSGSGEGETIEVAFDAPTPVDAVELMPGFFDPPR